MNTYIVNESSSNIRTLARQALKGQWKSAALAMLIYFVCIAVPTIIIVALFGGFSEEALMSDEVMMPGEGLSTVYSLLVGGAFTFGIIVYFLDLVRKQKSDIGSVFCGFSYFFKTLLLNVLISIFVLLWACLLIVPGIIAALRYSQAFYILADDPSKDIMDCIRESKEMMKGNKGKLFCLQLSFIGWYLLVYLAMIVISGIAVSISIMVPSDASFVISMIILAIGMIAVLIGLLLIMPYVQTATTVFYEMANGNLQKKNDETPQYQDTPIELPPLSQDGFESLVNNNNDSVNQDEIKF